MSVPIFRLFRILVALIALGLSQFASADDFLEPEQAFKLSARVLDERQLELRFVIAPGHYMYREQYKVELKGTGELGEVQIPDGKKKYDETFQKEVEVYRGEVLMRVALKQAQGAVDLAISGQGCADKGLCYPPMTRPLRASLKAFGGDGSVSLLPPGEGIGSFGDADAGAQASSASKEPAPAPEIKPSADGKAVEGGKLDLVLQSGRFWVVVGLFFLGGVGLSLTPCVLPMVPILASIIVGSGEQTSRRRGLLLAISYSQGMALVYTALGIAAGKSGEGLAAYFQAPPVLAAFGGALVIFSLSMFGAYELRLPSRLADSLNDASQRLQGGKLFAVFMMGALSALLVSPCVTGVLASALLYLSKTQDVVLGGSALYAMANGMSVPLLLVGVSAGTLLPRAGPWMDGVKHFFGMVLLGVALWTVQPILPDALTQALMGAWAVGAALALGLLKPWHASAGPRAWLRKTLAFAALAFGLAQWLGAAAGGTDPLRPLAGMQTGGGAQAAVPRAAADTGELRFQPVRSVAELDAVLASAGRPVMLDFYADWCKSCKEMERFTFSDARVKERLSQAVLLKADVTANSADDRALLKRFKLFGPPGTIFFDAKGQEMLDQRVIGFQEADRFLASLSAAGI